MRDRKNVLIVLNPHSGRGAAAHKVAYLAETLRLRGVDSRQIDDLSLVEALAAQPPGTSGGIDAIIAAGGDGTVSAVAQRAHSEIPILVYPLGTENVLARELGLSADAGMAVTILERGRVSVMDAGLANGRFFLLMCGIGFDADVVRRVEEARKGPITKWIYFWPILSALGGFRFPRLTVEAWGPCPTDPIPGHSQSFEAGWLFAMNIPRYAAGLKIAPGADRSDGFLDLCMFRRSGIGSGCRYLFMIWLRKHQAMTDFRIERAHRAIVTSNIPTPYQVDGDFGGMLPLEMAVLPQRVRLLVP